MNYHAIIKDGALNIGSEFQRQAFKKFLKNHEGAKIEFVPILPESRKQRAYYHGAILPLWCYLDGRDYHNHEILEQYHEIAKIEFNGAVVVSHGKSYKIGRSTKQKLSQGFLEAVITFLEEQYGIDRQKVLNPAHYKDFRDRVYGFTDYDSYISYLKDLNLL